MRTSNYVYLRRRFENVSDDWDAHWTTCECGHRYHASEGGCQACADEDQEREDEEEEEEDGGGDETP